MVTGFAEKKVGKRETTNGDYEEVTPHLIIGFFDIQSDGDQSFDICDGMGEMKGIGDGVDDWAGRRIGGLGRAGHAEVQEEEAAAEDVRWGGGDGKIKEKLADTMQTIIYVIP